MTKQEIMEGIKCDSSKLIALNTVRYFVGDKEVIRLHKTDIVTKENGVTTLDSGGWKTKVTKDRMNEHIYPAQIRQEKGQWYLALQYKKHLFADGIQIGPKGGIRQVGKQPKIQPNKRISTARIL